MKNVHLLVTTAWVTRVCDKSPATIADVIEELHRLSRRHHRLCERICNEDQRDYDAEGMGHLDRALKRCEVRMSDTLAGLECPYFKLAFQGDPRGATTYLVRIDADVAVPRDRYYL